MRLTRCPVPDDFDRAVQCASCDEWLPENQALFHDGVHFHPRCRPDLVRCGWCGDGILKTEAKQVGTEFFHRLCSSEVM